MKQLDWYFDFISPFAYLVSASLHRLPADIELRPRPILFAGLLRHWQTRGPAEIEPMRQFTFRHISWLAQRDGIELKLPPAHPFNPLKMLRLCVAEGSSVELVQSLFQFIWAQGQTADDAQQWQQFTAALGITDADEKTSRPEVKQALIDNTETAIAEGIFGVPGFSLDGEVFWGYDSLDFLCAYLRDPAILAAANMRAADELPQGLARKI